MALLWGKAGEQVFQSHLYNDVARCSCHKAVLVHSELGRLGDSDIKLRSHVASNLAIYVVFGNRKM